MIFTLILCLLSIPSAFASSAAANTDNGEKDVKKSSAQTREAFALALLAIPINRSRNDCNPAANGNAGCVFTKANGCPSHCSEDCLPASIPQTCCKHLARTMKIAVHKRHLESDEFYVAGRTSKIPKGPSIDMPEAPDLLISDSVLPTLKIHLPLLPTDLSKIIDLYALECIAEGNVLINGIRNWARYDYVTNKCEYGPL